MVTVGEADHTIDLIMRDRIGHIAGTGRIIEPIGLTIGRITDLTTVPMLIAHGDRGITMVVPVSRSAFIRFKRELASKKLAGLTSREFFLRHTYARAGS